MFGPKTLSSATRLAFWIASWRGFTVRQISFFSRPIKASLDSGADFGLGLGVGSVVEFGLDLGLDSLTPA